ncbi:MAG: hypothetical protein CM15mP77_1610 [Synechococcus sp.]|nr:MAG: hypothetical protein CM15mP77_1610 [Synechococcus sp.]
MGRSRIETPLSALTEATGPTNQASMSKAWVPSAPITPPPLDACEYQFQPRLGQPLPINQSSFTNQGWPTAPERSRRSACMNSGTARYS